MFDEIKNESLRRIVLKTKERFDFFPRWQQDLLKDMIAERTGIGARHSDILLSDPLFYLKVAGYTYEVRYDGILSDVNDVFDSLSVSDKIRFYNVSTMKDDFKIKEVDHRFRFFENTDAKYYIPVQLEDDLVYYCSEESAFAAANEYMDEDNLNNLLSGESLVDIFEILENRNSYGELKDNVSWVYLPVRIENDGETVYKVSDTPCLDPYMAGLFNSEDYDRFLRIKGVEPVELNARALYDGKSIYWQVIPISMKDYAK